MQNERSHWRSIISVNLALPANKFRVFQASKTLSAIAIWPSLLGVPERLTIRRSRSGSSRPVQGALWQPLKAFFGQTDAKELAKAKTDKYDYERK